MLLIVSLSHLTYKTLLLNNMSTQFSTGQFPTATSPPEGYRACYLISIMCEITYSIITLYLKITAYNMLWMTMERNVHLSRKVPMSSRRIMLRKAVGMM